MKKSNYIILILSIFLLLPRITYAVCDDESLNHFKEIEDEYKVTYEFNESTKKYTLIFTCSERDTYDYNLYYEKPLECEDIDEHISKCYNVDPGTYKIEIAGRTFNCPGVLKEFTMTLSKYNVYSEDSLCDDIKEFVLCQPTYDKEIDYESFVSRVNTYKKSKIKQQSKEKKGNKILDNVIFDYIEDNMIQIIAIVVFTVVLIITIIVTAKSIRKSRRLE